jgi:hypothetical protein
MNKSAVCCALALAALSAWGGSDSNNGGASSGTSALGGSSHNYFNASCWLTSAFAPKFAAHKKNLGAGAQGFCDATLGFGLPAADGKPFVDKLWSANIPNHYYWNGVLSRWST